MRPEQAIDELAFIFDEDIEEQERLTELSEAEASKIRLEFRQLFLGSAIGKRVLSVLLNESGVFEDSFTGNSRTFYNEGRRVIGLLLLDFCFNLKDRQEDGE